MAKQLEQFFENSVGHLLKSKVIWCYVTVKNTKNVYLTIFPLFQVVWIKNCGPVGDRKIAFLNLQRLALRDVTIAIVTSKLFGIAKLLLL